MGKATKGDRELKKARFTESDATIYTWKSKYGGMDVSEAKRLRGLEEETRQLKHLVADLSLDKEVLKTVIRRNGWSLPALEPT